MNKLTKKNLATEKCPVPDQVVHRFTEIIICEELEIPPQKPPKEHIADTSVEPIVDDIEVIDVDLGDIERRKVIVAGNLNIGIEYSALEPEQQIHFAHFNVPFQGIIGYRPCIAGSSGNRGLLLPCFDIDDFDVNVCIEHVQFHQITERKIKVVVVLLIWLDFAFSINIIEPEEGETVSGDVDITAVVTNGIDISSVEFEYSDDGGTTFNEIATVSSPGPYTTTWDSNDAEDGDVIIRATATPDPEECNYPDLDDELQDNITIEVDNAP